MRAFIVEISITAVRVGNDYSIKSRRVIDVDDDRNIDELLDVPLGKLILGSSYRPKEEPKEEPMTFEKARELGLLQTEEWRWKHEVECQSPSEETT